MLATFGDQNKLNVSCSMQVVEASYVFQNIVLSFSEKGSAMGDPLPLHRLFSLFLDIYRRHLSAVVLETRCRTGARSPR